MSPRPHAAKTDAIVIALVACATLVVEVLLTRVSALRIAFHFSYLVISAGLLGMGAAGTALHLARRRIAGEEDRWTVRLTVGFALSLPVSYALLALVPVPAHVRLRDAGELATFGLYCLGAIPPFALGGGVIALILTRRAESVQRYYALDLGGAALGALVCPALLWWAGAGGALAVALGLAWVAAAAATCGRARMACGALAVASFAVAPSLDAWAPVVGKNHIQVTNKVTVRTRENHLFSLWSALSRVDVMRVPEDQRNLFMRGTLAGKHPEEQVFVMQDGSAGTFVHDFTGTPEGLEVLRRTLYCTAARVLRPSEVFVIGVGGAPDLWAHWDAGASRIKGVDLNRQMLDLHTELFPEYSRDLLADGRVELVHVEARHALLREEARYDLVQMSAIDTWTSLVSGAYMLAENYLYTRQAVDDMAAVLRPGGALQITRFAGTVEALRLLGTLAEVHARRGRGDFADCVVSLRANTFQTVLMKLAPLSGEELERLDDFAEEAGLELVLHPGRELGGPLEAFVHARDKAAFAATVDADVAPVDDDRPYFFHFDRWRDWSGLWSRIDAPMVVTQGNPLMLLGQLALSLVAALVLVVLPLSLAEGRPRGLGARGTLAGLVYFAAVGFGFIALEVALMQKLVLLLGHPVYSISVSLAGLLAAMALGAVVSERWFGAPTRLRFAVPALLAVLLSAFASFDAELVRAAAPLPLVGRVGVALAVLVPIGALVGVPLSHGIRLLERRAPGCTAWAWAINAVFTVTGSIATVILSMNFGFRFVFAVAVAAYALAALVAGALEEREQPVG